LSDDFKKYQNDIKTCKSRLVRKKGAKGLCNQALQNQKKLTTNFETFRVESYAMR